MDSSCPTTPLDSRPMSPEDVMDYPDRVSSPAFAHPTPMQAGGLPQEALLQLELKKVGDRGEEAAVSGSKKVASVRAGDQ